MDQLYFGPKTRRRLRRRERIKRAALYSWVLTLGAAMFGVALPGPGVAFDLFARMAGDEQVVQVASVGVESTETAESTTKLRRGIAKDRPTPSPSATATEEPVTSVPAAYSGGSIVDIIYAAAAEFGVSGDWMVSIAECESGLDPNAYNAAGYHGLFQYDTTTWAGYGYGDIFDPVAQARTTAELLAAGQSSRWPNCA